MKSTEQKSLRTSGTSEQYFSVKVVYNYCYLRTSFYTMVVSTLTQERFRNAWTAKLISISAYTGSNLYADQELSLYVF